MWIVVERDGLPALRAKLGWPRGSEISILYGDKRPGRERSIQLSAAYGIPIESWSAAPSVAFVLPALRAKIVTTPTVAA